MAVTDSSDDYRAVRYEGAGLIDLSSRRGRILVGGRDAAMFLNGLVTNDVKNLARGSWIPAVFANVQGRLIAAVRIIHRDDGFLIDTETVTRDKVVDLLSRFTLAGDFRVTDLTEEVGTLSLQGKKSAGILASVLGDQSASLNRGCAIQSAFNEKQVTIIRATHTAEEGFDVFIESSEREALHDALWHSRAEIVKDETLEVLRIEAGIPRFGIDMTENTVVSEANLDDAISDTKGCYVGQEIIIRIKHRGHVAKKLTGVVLETPWPFEEHAEVISDDHENIGNITSLTLSPCLDRQIALAYLKYDHLEEGTRIRVEHGENPVAAEVASLPMVRGSWVTADDVIEPESEISEQHEPA
jgi:folate-binding protein YgfZ